jgi:hypothetical protein
MRTRSLRKIADSAHREQRRHVGDRGGVDHRQPRERGEIAEHGADRGQPAPEMPERTADANRRHQLAAPGINDHHRQDREGGAKEHHLPDRVALADPAHQHRHHGEQERRHELEQNGLEEIHAEPWRAAERAPC